MSKFVDFLKAFFSGGGVFYNKENGWHTKTKDEVANDVYHSSSDGAWLSDVVGNVSDKYLGTGLTDAEESANAFIANEAALQRDWSSQEAERARDWNEEMYEKYNSLSGKIAQAEQAGVNPMFAVTGNAVSPMAANASSPSGASGGSVSPTGHGLTDLIGSLMGVMKLKSEIELNQARARKDNADAESGEITNETLKEWNVTQILEAKSRIVYNNENTALVTSKILNTDADTEKKSAELGQIAASIANMEADTDVKVQQLGVMASEILKNTKSIDVMTAQIAEMASNVGLNRSRAGEIAQNLRNLVQEYNHNTVMYALNEMITSARATDANFKNPANYTGVERGVRQFLNELKDLLSFGFSNK